MKHRYLLLTVIMLFAACNFICCSSDEDDNSTPTPDQDTHLQVTLVFAPGQLGDNGYCDRVITAAYQLKDSVGSGEVLDVEFIAKRSLSSTYEEMETWARDAINPIHNYAYTRRLLVLTEGYMIPWLSHVKDFMRSTDEVLVLKATDDDILPANEQLQLGSRLHAMSISLAQSTQDFVYYLNNHDAKRFRFALIRLFNDTIIHYRDSIYETLRKEGIPEDSIIHVCITDTPEVLYTSLDKTKASLNDIGFLNELPLTNGYYRTDYPNCIADLGSANSGFESLVMSLFSNSYLKNIVLIDTEIPNGVLPDFQCYYDKALPRWCTRWMRQPPAAMPVMEWYGAWDGYSTSYFSLLRKLGL